MQDFYLIYDGTAVDSKIGAGVSENSIADYSYAARFTLTGVTELSRIELELDSDGVGADITVQIRSGLTSSDDGTLLKEVVVPKEFIPTTATYWSIPINLTGLVSGNQYWIVVKNAGDAINKLDWIGEASVDASYPVYRRAGNTGNWTTGQNALHLKIYSGEVGELKHGIYGTYGYTTVEYSSETVSKVYRFLPAKDIYGVVDWASGIRNIQTYTWNGEYLKAGVVT
ncbi:MAG: hypothetical protein HGA27_00230 [Peptococcaceae bacterium]|nr:hypothetical protein [Peptococcaceae bacterium]